MAAARRLRSATRSRRFRFITPPPYRRPGPTAAAQHHCGGSAPCPAGPGSGPAEEHGGQHGPGNAAKRRAPQRPRQAGSANPGSRSFQLRQPRRHLPHSPSPAGSARGIIGTASVSRTSSNVPSATCTARERHCYPSRTQTVIRPGNLRTVACGGFATLDPETTPQDPEPMKNTGTSSLPAVIRPRLANPAP